MPCVAPILLKRRGSHHTDSNQYVGCGRCIPCRLDYSLQWATRCVHESEMHPANSFITLTFDPEFVPEDGSLSKREAQLFLKRLRKRIGPFRYFLAGEYGDRLGRPHYHACIFGHAFPDSVPLSADFSEYALRRSPTLEAAWPFGFSSIGEFNFQTAAYVARYCVKKINGAPEADHYQGRIPEFALMSRSPGLGFEWFARYKSDVFPRDEVRVNGVPRTPPRYYLSKLSADEQFAVKSARSIAARSKDPEHLRGFEATVLHHHQQRKRKL